MIFGRQSQCLLIAKLARRVTVKDFQSVNSVQTSGLGSSKLLVPNHRWYLLRAMSSGPKAHSSKTLNRLALEKSPYLLQHATNPVDWYPWGDEAFEKAKKEDKLIFLSVGYSTCHWCHVMERESFENEDVAKIMNEHFINIKVDREERPDVDRLYMTFVQATSGGGGWPMSVWLTPELLPVYGGTYYPPDDAYGGMPGFKTLLAMLNAQWRENRQKFTESGKRVAGILKRLNALGAAEAAGLGPVGRQTTDSAAERCLTALSSAFEPRYGGFGGPPKFPQVSNMDFLLHEWARAPQSEEGKEALHMVAHTLRCMAHGGIHDHVAQGFARYSVDAEWHVPHFEKMLYDQAQLAVAYSATYLATKEQLFADVTRDILQYVDRDLSHEEGGFFSAEDADSYPSEGAPAKREGAFCVWTHAEVQRLLQPLGKMAKTDGGEADGPAIADLFCQHYDVRSAGNVRSSQDPHGELAGQNVLRERTPLGETAKKLNVSEEAAGEALARARRVLFDVRLRRPRPALDDKVVTAWNGLMISAFARAGEALSDPDLVKRGERAAAFALKHLASNEDGTRLWRCVYGGKSGQTTGSSGASSSVVERSPAPVPGFLCDYAYLVRGLLDLYEASLDPQWLLWADRLQDAQDELFWDEEGGGYFTSAAGDETLLFRSKEDQDGAEPAANGVSATSLQRLAALLERNELRARAQRLVEAFSPRLARAPHALPSMWAAARLLRDGPVFVVVSGRADDPATQSLLAVVRSRLLPGRALILAGGEGPLHDRVESLRSMCATPARAYICRRRTCSLPVTDAEALAALLDAPPSEFGSPPSPGSPVSAASLVLEA